MKKFRHIVSSILAVSIIAQTTAFADIGNLSIDKEILQEEYDSSSSNLLLLGEKTVDQFNEYHETAEVFPQETTYRRGLLNPLTESYSMPLPAENESRIIVTAKHASASMTYQAFAEENMDSEAKSLGERRMVMNVDDQELVQLTDDPDYLVENDYLVYKSGTDEDYPTEDVWMPDVSVMIGNYYPSNFESLGIKEYHDKEMYGDGVKIAILDTGLNTKSTELNIRGGVTFVDGSDSFADNDGHGTAMAGIIGAAMDDEGLVGIAPNAELYSVKVLNGDGVGYVSSVIQGINWAINNDMDIICFGFASENYSHALADAVADAAEKGIIMIAPSGNDGKNTICYPAGYSQVISVGSTDVDGNISSFSNYGEGVDVYAPGESVDSILYMNNKPTPFSGTSAAAAYVAGITALFFGENVDNADFLTGKPGVFIQDNEPTVQVSSYATARAAISSDYVDIVTVSDENAGIMTSSAISIQHIAPNGSYTKTFTKLGQKHHYSVTLKNYNQAVSFELKDKNFDEDIEAGIYYEYPLDENNILTYNVTGQTLALQEGRVDFYVYCEGSDTGNFQYTLELTTKPYDNTITKIYTGYGIDDTTGNFTYTFDDLSAKVAGKDFVIQRRYNSRDLTQNHFNSGWTFNLEGKAEYGSTVIIDQEGNETENNGRNIISITIPDGKSLEFEKIVYEEDNKTYCVFQARNSRAEMKSSIDLTSNIIITMPDQTKYYYYPIETSKYNKDNHSPGCLYKITDKYGNNTEIDLKNGKIIGVRDITGNQYTFTYTDKKLTSISDTFGRTVTYTYNGSRLVQSTDSTGMSYFYTYYNNDLLSEIRNDQNAPIAKITYKDLDELGLRYKVKSFTDQYGTSYEYEYDTLNYKTFVKENTPDADIPKKTETGYDIERDVTYFVNAGNQKTITEYYYYEAIDFTGRDPDGKPGVIVDELYRKYKNGEILSHVDVTGAKTQYEYPHPLDTKNDYSLGLPISKTILGQFVHNDYEILGYEEYTYDQYGNIILEKQWIDKKDRATDTYKATRYIYDDAGVYLLKKAEYLPTLKRNETVPLFDDAHLNQYAVTSYEYNTTHKIKGLVSKITYPEQYTGAATDKGWTYEYDSNGNCISVINPESSIENPIVQAYEYNDLGWVCKEISGEGDVTEYKYDNNGREIKRVINSTEVYRTVYNSIGLPIQIIEPNQYNPSCENSDGIYTDTLSGTRFEYDSVGLLIKKTDPDGYITQYSYDQYGNVKSEITPNSSSYHYYYDLLDNLSEVFYAPDIEARYQLIQRNMLHCNSGRIYTACSDYGESENNMLRGIYLIYDARGRLLQKRDMMRATDYLLTNNGYDLLGNISFQDVQYEKFAWGYTAYKNNLFDIDAGCLYSEKYDSTGFNDVISSTVNTWFGSSNYRYEKTVYDKNGNVISTVASDKIESSTPNLTPEHTVTETREYYADNLLKSVTDALGVKTEYEYDKDRLVSKITVTAPGKEPTIIAYENNHHGKPATIKTYLSPDRITDAADLLEDSLGYYTLTTNTYDKNGNLIEQIPTVGAKTTFTYNNRNLQTSVTLSSDDGKTMTESCIYDDMGNITEQTDRNGNVTKFVYNKLGYLIYTIHPNGGVTFTVRDNCGRATAQVNPIDYTGNVSLNNASLSEYDTDLANLANMNRTEYTYNQNDQLLTATKYTYDTNSKSWNSVVEETNTYDYQQHLLTTTDALGNTAKFQYDALGNCVKYSDPIKSKSQGYTRAYEYDMLGRMTKESNAYGDAYTYAYDKKGNLTGVQLTSDGETASISSYTYDPTGKLLTQTDGNGHTTSLVYDDNNFLKVKYAHGGENDLSKTDSYKFDSRGNLTEHTDRNGNTVVNTYDDFNRLTRTECDGEVISYTYDNIGNVLTMTDSSGVTTYTYDSMGRILTQNHSVTGTVSYTYDIYENIPYGFVAETTTDPKGNIVQKWYDSADQIYKVIDNSAVTEYTYYDNGKLHTINYPLDGKSVYTYDAVGNVLTLSNQDASGEVVDSFSYIYSDEYLNGWNQTRSDGSGVGTTFYEYDAQGRLTKVENQRTGINTYTYDAAGNRLSKIGTYLDDKVVDEYTYDEQNRLLQVKSYLDGSADASYTYYDYDNNGNQISRWTQSIHADGGEEYYCITELGVKSTDGTALYGYDNYNRLVSVHQDSTTIENVYNGLGDNVSRITDGVTTNYVYDGNTVILELNGSGEQTARNVYGRNLILRSGEDDREIYYMYNGHGDVVRTTYAGYTMAKYRYDEFGNVTYEEDCYEVESGLSPHLTLNPVEPSDEFVPERVVTECYVENPYRYAGYEYLENVDLYDLNARYYDPNTARFLSEDPYYDLGNRVMGLYEINVPNVFSIMQANALYAYCGNCPIMFIDYFGTEYVAVSGGVYKASKQDSDEYYYEFIDAATAQIDQWIKEDKDELITWMIADYGWTDDDKAMFKKYYSDNENVQIYFIQSTDDIYRYTNNKTLKEVKVSNKARLEDPIKGFSVFSHGLSANDGTIPLAFDYSGGNNTEEGKKLTMTKDFISKIDKKSFDETAISSFYSCNTGTAGRDSFAQSWANQTGTITYAYKGKSYYGDVASNALWDKIMRFITKNHHIGGKTKLPVAAEDSIQLKFLPEEVHP